MCKVFIAIFGLSIVICFIGCKTGDTTYIIDEKYSGPCIVFVYPNDSKNNINSVILSNGLGVIKLKNAKANFIFKSKEKKTLLKIINIGEEANVKDNNSYIFRLTKNTSYSHCSNTDLNTITFFVGTISDFTNWSQKNQTEFDFFDSVGIDWCSFYKNHL